jgi:outer membrane protein
MKTPQSLLALFCACSLVVQPGFAEQNTTVTVITTPIESHWYTPFTRKYVPPYIPPINVSNSMRIDSLIRAGRLYLSLQDAIALALENSLDIEIQRYGPLQAQANLLRAQAGGLIRGVTSSVSTGPSSASNQLSGTSGGGGGGVGVSTGGASSGTIITSTGTNIPNLDEFLSIGYNWGHRTSPNSNSFTTGVPASVYNNGQFSLAAQKGWLTGTTASLSYYSSGLNSNNVRSEINPVTSAAASLQVTQHLLQGFGIAVNNRNIRIAKNSITISDLQFKQQVMSTVSSVLNLYSDLVSFNDDVRVKRQSVLLNEKLYNDNKKQVEIGTLAPIEIVRAEAELARSQQDLTQSETQLLQQETIIKNFLSRSGLSEPALAEARIVPTDHLRIPDTEQVTPIQDLVEKAIANRPELAQTRLNIENSRIQLAGSRSQLLPALDLQLAATNNGLAGAINSIPDPTGSLGFIRQANPTFVGGFGTLFSQILGRNFPDYSIGFQLNVPLRNRSAQADMILDSLNIRQGELQQRKQINQIRVDVQNALIGLQQARAQYQSAVKSRILQEQTLDAEQKKYTLGASTIFFVIQAQRDLAQAQAAEVVALSVYNHSHVQLDQATGDTLQNNGVILDEVRTGKVSRAPSAIPETENR